MGVIPAPGFLLNNYFLLVGYDDHRPIAVAIDVVIFTANVLPVRSADVGNSKRDKRIAGFDIWQGKRAVTAGRSDTAHFSSGTPDTGNVRPTYEFVVLVVNSNRDDRIPAILPSSREISIQIGNMHLLVP